MIKNNTSQFFLLSVAVLLAACSPDKQDKVKESAVSAPLSSVLEKSNTNDKTVETDINKVESAPSSNCTNLHQIDGIDDFVRQVAENIDSSCLNAALKNWRRFGAFPAEMILWLRQCFLISMRMTLKTLIK